MRPCLRKRKKERKKGRMNLRDNLEAEDSFPNPRPHPPHPLLHVRLAWSWGQCPPQGQEPRGGRARKREPACLISTHALQLLLRTHTRPHQRGLRGDKQKSNLGLPWFFLPQELPLNSLALYRAFVTEGTPVHGVCCNPSLALDTTRPGS